MSADSVAQSNDDPGAGEAAAEDPGDAACWAHLVCPECGNVASEGHRDGCSLAVEE